ncbi:hypothetical protein SEVIR_5G212450v4 [Setaria viridis]
MIRVFRFRVTALWNGVKPPRATSENLGLDGLRVATLTRFAAWTRRPFRPSSFAAGVAAAVPRSQTDPILVRQRSPNLVLVSWCLPHLFFVLRTAGFHSLIMRGNTISI